MTARSLLIGFDGFDLGVVKALGKEQLPTLFELMERGVFAASQSVMPPATLPNWSTILTGTDPGYHGVFDFTTRQGYKVAFTAGTIRKEPTIFARLDQLGLRCACVGFPATWPPETLKNGITISGWDSPVAFEADRSFVSPRSLYTEIRERFGRLEFDNVNEFRADDSKWLADLPSALCERIDKKTELALWLLQKERWDVCAFYFGESDTAAHYLWSLHDTSSPRRNSICEELPQRGLAQVYARLDLALSRIWQTAGGDHVEISVVSDHGFGGSSNKVLYLNRVLEEAGLLRFSRSAEQRLAHVNKEFALRVLPRRVQDKVFQWRGRLLPSWLESRARFGAIDMSRTAAFSDELNYFPAIHLNILGREPNGTVLMTDVDALISRIEEALYSLRDPWTSAPVVRRVMRRDDLFDGPYLERAPDLLLDLHDDNGYTYNLMPSAKAPTEIGAWRLLNRDEYLGKKGRSLPGSHRAQGFALLAGPSVLPNSEVEMHVADVTATLLARMKIAVPTHFSGRILWQYLRDDDQASAMEPLPSVSQIFATSIGNVSNLEGRLRALGYLD